MFVIIAIMLSGGIAGYLLRQRHIVKYVSKLITALIWFLLLTLGIEVGGNEQIMSGLAALGIESLILSMFATLGSVLAAWGLWTIIARKKGGAHEG